MQVMNIAFVGHDNGQWEIDAMTTLCGEPLPAAPFLSRYTGDVSVLAPAWQLNSFTSNLRYTTGAEVAALNAHVAPLGRRSADCAALIPIRKSDAWWLLPQDERRTIYEERSRHTSIGLEYMPRIARKLHHCRDLGEPFDFLTWFEFAAEDTGAFDELLQRLRATEEWQYVDREIDIRMSRAALGDKQQ